MRGRLAVCYSTDDEEKKCRYLLFGFKLVNLLDVHGETTCCVEPSRTQSAFEVLRFLMLH